MNVIILVSFSEGGGLLCRPGRGCYSGMTKILPMMLSGEKDDTGYTQHKGVNIWHHTIQTSIKLCLKT